MSDSVNTNDYSKPLGVKFQQNGGVGMEPSVDMVSPFYESLPGAPGKSKHQDNRTLGSPSLPKGRTSSIGEEEMMGQNPLYSADTGKPMLPKKNISKRQYDVTKPPPSESRRKKSDLVTYGVVICFMGIILLIAVAALIISLFVLLGVISIPAVEELRALERNISALELQLQAPPTTTAVPANTSAPPTTAPTVDSPAAMMVVNFSDCVVYNRSSNLTGTNSVTVGLPLDVVPQYVLTMQPELRTRVMVEQYCWFSNVQGASGLQSSFQYESEVLPGRPVFRCVCSKGSVGGSAVCNFYYKECSLATVYV